MAVSWRVATVTIRGPADPTGRRPRPAASTGTPPVRSSLTEHRRVAEPGSLLRAFLRLASCPTSGCAPYPGRMATPNRPQVVRPCVRRRPDRTHPRRPPAAGRRLRPGALRHQGGRGRLGGRRGRAGRLLQPSPVRATPPSSPPPAPHRRPACHRHRRRRPTGEWSVSRPAPPRRLGAGGGSSGTRLERARGSAGPPRRHRRRRLTRRPRAGTRRSSRATSSAARVERRRPLRPPDRRARRLYRTTRWSTRIELLVTEPSPLVAAVDLLHRELDGVEAVASRFRPDSELSLLHRPWPRAGGRPVPVSPALAEALGDRPARRSPHRRRGRHHRGRRPGPARLRPGLRAARLRGRGEPARRPRPVPGWRCDRRSTARRAPSPPTRGRHRPGCHRQGVGRRPGGRRPIGSTFGCGVLVSLGGDLAVQRRPGGRVHGRDRRRLWRPTDAAARGVGLLRWPGDARASGAGTGCSGPAGSTTSSIRRPACRWTPPGARCRWPPARVSTPTRRRRPPW